MSFNDANLYIPVLKSEISNRGVELSNHGCTVCTFVYEKDAGMCPVCGTPSPLAMLESEMLAVALSVPDSKGERKAIPSTQIVCETCTVEYGKGEEMCPVCGEQNPSAEAASEMLVAALSVPDVIDAKQRQQNADIEAFDREYAIGLRGALNAQYRTCIACTTLNAEGRVQCMSCSIILDKARREMAAEQVDRKTVALGKMVFDDGVGILKEMGIPYPPNISAKCLAFAAAYAARHSGMSDESTAKFSERVAAAIANNPTQDMTVDILHTWFEGCEMKINLLYGTRDPVPCKSVNWMSLRKFDSECPSLIIVHHAGHFTVYS